MKRNIGAILSLFVCPMLYASDAINVFSCYSATAEKGETESAIKLNFEPGAHDIVVQTFECTDPYATASLGKRGDLVVLTPNQIPHKVNVNYFPLGRITKNRIQRNIAFPQKVGESILISYQPTQAAELASDTTIEFLIRRTKLSSTLQKSLSVKVNDALFTCYRRLQSKKRPQVSWLELAYITVPKKFMNTTFDVTVAANGDAIIRHPQTGATTWSLGIKNLFPVTKQLKDK